MMIQRKWNAAQCKVRSETVIYAETGFRFYILYDLKSFEIEICLLKWEEKGRNFSRQILSIVLKGLNMYKLNHTIAKLNPR